MVISQFFDALKVGFLFSYVAPLVFVLCVTLFKEAIDDIYRYKQDNITNLQEYNLLISDGNNGIIRRKIKSQDIKIGDILEINQNQRIPADMIILKTFDESGTIFIRTDQLDGETDWKLRKSPSLLHSLQSLEELFNLTGHLEYDAPSKMIYEFNGVLKIYNYEYREFEVNNLKTNDISNILNACKNKKEPLALENTMWASTILASKSAVGIVIYTGRESRFQMNSSNPKIKKGALDLELNYLSKILFFIMLISAVIITLLKGFRTSILSMILDFFRFVVLLCAIIPISLAVNLDISKAVNSRRINKDERIPDSIARNSTIPEELGRIEYIFSDKTGTLTKNEMEFKRLALENDNFGLDSFNDIKLILEDECQKFDAPAMDILNMMKNDNSGNENALLSDSFHKKENSDSIRIKNLVKNDGKLKKSFFNKRIRRNTNKIIRDTIAAMALCNNVTPVYEENDESKFINDYSIENDNVNKTLIDDNITNYENIKERNSNHLEESDHDKIKKCNDSYFLDMNRRESELKREYEVVLDVEKHRMSHNIQIETEEVEKKENQSDFEKNSVSKNLESENEVVVKKKEKLIQKRNQKINYQASSPDEVALVKTAEELNMTLVFRNDKEIKIKNAFDVIEEYDVLANFPFSSETKRMGILLRSKKHKHIIFYLKGAESIMEKFVKQEYISYIRENAENLACIGLRTLVFTQKVISEEFYQKWKNEYNEARVCLDNRNEKILQVLSRLETDMDFLAVTGVEDLLQDDVCNTIESLRNAGIKIWMLTGDKVETATCISISAGLKSKANKLFFIRDQAKEHQYVSNELKKLEANISQTVLIIDGDCLEVALNNHEKQFFEIAMKAPSVVCCRCSPTQKAKIVKQIKKYTKKRTCSIGDGGNDVAMIQQADVGIGLVGKEGLQASLASDFSITKFKHLSHLMLWLGRLSYKNTATISKFVIHRAVPIYNGMLILGYSTVYTSIPVISLLLDQDTGFKNVMRFPTLYKNLLKGRELSIKAFLWWFWKSLFQAAVIMIGAVIIFENIFLKIATITFTVLIFAELLNVYSEIKTFHRYMLFSIIGTLVVYLLSIIFLDSILDVDFIFDYKSISKTLFLAIISWLPFFIYHVFKYKCYPEETDILNLIEIKY